MLRDFVDDLPQRRRAENLLVIPVLIIVLVRGNLLRFRLALGHSYRIPGQREGAL